MCDASNPETQACSAQTDTVCGGETSAWTEADVRERVSTSCAGCHSTVRHAAWSLTTIYERVRVNSVGNRMPKNAANGGYWSAGEIEMLEDLLGL